MNSPHTVQNPSRREFLRTGTAAVAGSVVVWGLPACCGAPNDRELTLGLVGCGGRGTGGAVQALAADANTTITALGDAFPERATTTSVIKGPANRLVASTGQRAFQGAGLRGGRQAMIERFMTALTGWPSPG